VTLTGRQVSAGGGVQQTAGDHALVITIDGAASNSALVSIN
jgi:hypothetical protein